MGWCWWGGGSPCGSGVNRWGFGVRVPRVCLVWVVRERECGCRCGSVGEVWVGGVRGAGVSGGPGSGAGRGGCLVRGGREQRMPWVAYYECDIQEGTVRPLWREGGGGDEGQGLAHVYGGGGTGTAHAAHAPTIHSTASTASTRTRKQAHIRPHPPARTPARIRIRPPAHPHTPATHHTPPCAHAPCATPSPPQRSRGCGPVAA